MKKIRTAVCFIFVLSMLFSACSKNDAQKNNEYSVELKTISTQQNPVRKNSGKKFVRAIGNLFIRTDNQVKKRENAVLANFKDNKIIKIGIASSWTKNVTDAHDALLLALNEVNQKGGVAGAQIELVEGDDQADVNTGIRLAYKMSDDEEIFAVLGHAYSDITTPASLVYSYYGMPLFSPISTSHVLTQQKNSMIFRNIQDDKEFGDAAAEFCSVQGWKNVAIVYLDVTFAESIANEFELECAPADITVVTRDSFTLRQTESEYQNLFKKWKNNYKFDSIFVIGNMPQIGKIVSYIRDAGITQPIIGSDSFDDPLLESSLKDSENGRLFAISSFNSDSQNPEYLEFVKKFEAAYGHKPDQEGVQWYDAFMVLTGAIEQAGKPVASEIVQTLRNNIWSEAAGPYSFDSYGNMTGKPLVIKEMTQNGYKILW